MRDRPTIKDVAAQAGVSRQTVSRVINHKAEVAPETRDRVVAVIEELGFRPSAAARTMVVGRSRFLGCISPNLIDYTFASIIDSAQTEARRQGYLLLAGSAPDMADVETLLEELLRRQVDGLLVLNPCIDRRCRIFQSLPAKGVPVVYVASAPEDEPVSLVRCDDHEGGYRATRYLIERGHHTVATILGPSDEKCTADRHAGYLQALTEAGLTPDPALAERGNWSATSGFQATQRLLESRWPFSALFGQNDQMAVGAIRALREAGRRVPEDVSLIGFDDIPLASYFDPALTTLHQPLEEMGRQAARLLVETVHDPDLPHRQLLIPTPLVERASCTMARPGP